MNSQMSNSASAPVLLPSTGSPAVTPVLVPPKPRRSGPKWIGWILAIVVVGIIAERAIHYSRQRAASQSAAVAQVRVGAVTQGTVAKTLRLTGTTGAERFASLTTPRLRGGRGQGNRDGSIRSSLGTTTNTSTVVQSNARGSSSRSSSGGGTSSLDATGGGSVSSTIGQSTGGGSAAFQSATSRVSRAPAASSSARSSSSSTSSSTSSAVGASGLGSTSSSLMGGAGGGGGGTGGGGTGGGGGANSDFMLVLQEAVKPGSRVKKGDVVAEFDRQYMLQRLEDFAASVGQMDASVRKLEAELQVAREAHKQTIANAKADLEKAQLDVKTIPVLGAIEAERTRLAAEEASARYKQLLAEVKFVEMGQQSQLKAAQLEVQQAHLELRRSEANAERMRLKAPINGLAVMQNTFRGTEMAQIQPGDQLFPGMMFMQIVDTSSMVINASVNQVDVEALRIGQRAAVRFDAYPDLRVSARVSAIGAMTRTGGMRASYVKEIPILLKLEDVDPRIIPDLSVSVDVILGSEENATVAPLASIFQDGPDATPYVYVKSGPRWDRREVELGLTSNIQVVIKSGLKPGELVAEDRPPLSGESSGTKVSRYERDGDSAS